MAFELTRALPAPLNIFVVRHPGVAGQGTCARYDCPGRYLPAQREGDLPVCAFPAGHRTGGQPGTTRGRAASPSTAALTLLLLSLVGW